MLKLVNELNKVKTINKYLNEMGVYMEEDMVRIELDCTVYDYEFTPVELIKCLNSLGYELGDNCDWYNSVELHIYK